MSWREFRVGEKMRGARMLAWTLCNRQIPCPWQGVPKIRICEGLFLATFRQPDLLTPLSALDHVDLPLEGTYENSCLHEGFPSLVFLDSKSTLGTDEDCVSSVSKLIFEGLKF